MTLLALTGFILWIGSVIYYRLRIRAYNRLLGFGSLLIKAQNDFINSVIFGNHKPKSYSDNVIPFRRD